MDGISASLIPQLSSTLWSRDEKHHQQYSTIHEIRHSSANRANNCYCLFVCNDVSEWYINNTDLHYFSGVIALQRWIVWTIYIF